METEEILRIFEQTGALQKGHFELTSGLHSTTYFQCALVLQHPQYLEQFCREIIDCFYDDQETLDVVVAPAVGGIVVGQEVGRQLGIKSIFAERKDGSMMFRRGFTVEAQQNVLIVEDVITTGGTVQELVELVEGKGAFVVGIACVVDRSGGKSEIDIPICSVYSTKMITYEPENCPLCMEKKPLIKPGSRDLKA